tara:strand:- start:23374 stop:23859 length:486 start_codon:yes stop_codon:yes gene_type:complete
MNPIDHAWAVMKAGSVVIDGVTYVPQQDGAQQGGAQQGQPQEEGSQETFFPRFDVSGLQQDWQNRDESGGGLMGAAKNLGRRAWQGMKDSSIGQSLGQQKNMFDRNVGIKDKWSNMLQAREAEQQQLAGPNPEADSPLDTEQQQPSSVLDLAGDDDDPDAW